MGLTKKESQDIKECFPLKIQMQASHHALPGKRELRHNLNKIIVRMFSDSRQVLIKYICHRRFFGWYFVDGIKTSRTRRFYIIAFTSSITIKLIFLT